MRRYQLRVLLVQKKFTIMSSDDKELDAACSPRPKKPCPSREFQPGSLAGTSSAGEDIAHAGQPYYSSSHVTLDGLEAVKIVERFEAIERNQAIERMEADHKMALELDRQWNRPEEQRRRKSSGGSPSCAAGPSSTRLSTSSLTSPSHASCSNTSVSPIPLAQLVTTDATSEATSLSTAPIIPTENHFITTDSETSTTSSHTSATVTTELPSWWTRCPKCSPETNKPYHLIHLSLTEDPSSEQLVDTLTTQKILYSFIKCNLQVVSILRIQNPSLWRRYGAEKACMVAERGRDFNLNEELLFHTSRSPSKSICSEGLDMRLSRTGFFGKGIYFRYSGVLVLLSVLCYSSSHSDSPTKCNSYNHQTTKKPFKMYACSVLLGDAKVTFVTHAYRVVTNLFITEISTWRVRQRIGQRTSKGR